jgi:hypothetical protein
MAAMFSTGLPVMPVDPAVGAGHALKLARSPRKW